MPSAACNLTKDPSRLDENYIVFWGNEDEAASAHQHGTLVLCVTEPLTIKHIRLTLSGESRICWNLPSSLSRGSSHRAWKEFNFFEKVWTFSESGKGKTETLRPGNYEYPFDVILDGSLPESIEGLPESWVIYRFKADIGRKYAKDLHIRRPVRIIRTLGPSGLETVYDVSLEKIWPDKVAYTISTPTKAIILGTSVQVNFRFVPLSKGLRIGLVTTRVLETHDFRIEQQGYSSPKNHEYTRTVAHDTYNVDEAGDLEIIDEAVEGYRFSRHLELPKTLKHCLQDVDSQGITITHKLRFHVDLHNSDGHISKLFATLPILLYISPALAINDENELVDQSPVASRQAYAHELMNAAPPPYGQHQFDRFYPEVDASECRTPENFSASGTTFGLHSRNISVEGLGSHGTPTRASKTNETLTPGNSHVSPVAGRHHLQNTCPGGFGPAPLRRAMEDHRGEHDHNANVSRRTSATSSYFASNDHPPEDTDISTQSSSHQQHTRVSSEYGHSVNGRSPSHYPQYGDQHTARDSETMSRPNEEDSGSSSTTLPRNLSDEGRFSIRLPNAETPTQLFRHTEGLARIPSYRTAVRAPFLRTYSNSDIPSYGAHVCAIV